MAEAKTETADRAGRTTTPKVVSVIDIGSTAIRMVVAEIHADGSWTNLDRAGKPVPLGRDVFLTGHISQDTMKQALSILGGFREMLDGWRIEGGNVQVIATNALREAKNRDTFIDRVAIRTGFMIQILEGIEQSHLTFVAVQDSLRALQPQLSRSNSLIMEVGGGSTELMLLQRGKMVGAHSLRIGTVRIEEQMRAASGTMEYLVTFLQEMIRTMREVLDTELNLKRIRYFIAVGGDARLAALQVGRQPEEEYSVIERRDFDTFVRHLQNLSIDQLVRELQITYHDAEGLVSALLVYKQFFDATSATNLIVPTVSIREGVILNLIMGPDPAVQEEFYSQVVASALSLGRKYHVDERHSRHVAQLAMALFDELASEHGLDPHGRLLLEVAGILHDIGNYVKTSGHHKHGQYLVENSEIFGLHRSDLAVIANVVRYHRKSLPSSSHTSYISLPREKRITVLKLSAILRVADGMDRGHQQRIRGFRVEKTADALILHGENDGDFSAERVGVQEKGDLFEDVFGMTAILT